MLKELTYVKSIYDNNSALRGIRDEEDEDDETCRSHEGSQSDPLMQKFIKTRQIILSGEINKPLAEKVIRQLLVLESDSDEPIRVFIDSPGGDADAGYAIFDMIRFVNAPVYTIGMGLVASAGSIILLAAPKGGGLAFPTATISSISPSPASRASRPRSRFTPSSLRRCGYA
jgi:ATP-dependent Clp protease protease subunit